MADKYMVDKRFVVSDKTEIRVKDGMVKHLSEKGEVLVEIKLEDIENVIGTSNDLTVEMKDGTRHKFLKSFTKGQTILFVFLFLSGIILGLLYLIIWFSNHKDMMIEYGRTIEKALEKKEVKEEKIVVQQNSNADELMKYKNLYDQGIITQEEFEAKKKQLLGL